MSYRGKVARLQFARHLLEFLVPLLISIAIFGAFATALTQNYIRRDIGEKNDLLMAQIGDRIENVWNHVGSLKLYFSPGSYFSTNLSYLLNQSRISYEEYSLLKLYVSSLYTPLYAYPYIHSAYFYVDNEQRKFITGVPSVVVVDEWHDTSWLEEYLEQDPAIDAWSSVRFLPTSESTGRTERVITFYGRLDSGSGVIVLNVYPEYIEEMLSDLTTSGDQSIVITAGDGEILFSTGTLIPGFPSLEYDDPQGVERIRSDGAGYVVSWERSSDYNWTYYSLTPRASLYRVSDYLILITLSLMTVIVLIGVGFSYAATKRYFRQIRNVENLIDAAERGLEIPNPVGSDSSDYAQITEGLIRNFIKNRFLKVQLSEKAYQMRTLELLALQSQIRPHFIFNTLHTIYWESIRELGKPGTVSSMIGSLSTMLEFYFRHSSSVVTFAEEITNTRNYINIQRMKYGSCFDVVWHYSSSILNDEVPKLLFQPFIENSIYHGFAGRSESAESGRFRIRISIRKSPRGDYRISIVDNGVGLSEAELHEVNQAIARVRDGNPDCQENQIEDAEHIGLNNTYRRLILTYGEGCRMQVRSRSGYGTSVRITIAATGKDDFGATPPEERGCEEGAAAVGS